MRLLEFKVNQQAISKQPGCDFSGIVAGSAGYLKARFNCSDEWNGLEKQAIFWYGDEQRRTVALDDQNECVIPTVVLTGDSFEVSIKGVRSGRNEYRIETNKYKVRQAIL